MSAPITLLAPQGHGMLYQSFVESIADILTDVTQQDVQVVLFRFPDTLRWRSPILDRLRRRSSTQVRSFRRVTDKACMSENSRGALDPRSTDGVFHHYSHPPLSLIVFAVFRATAIAVWAGMRNQLRALPSARHRGIVFGDLALAAAFRHSPPLAGRVQVTTTVIRSLAQAIVATELIHRYARSLLSERPTETVFSTYCEHTYPDLLVARTLASFGVCSVGADRSAHLSLFCASTTGSCDTQPWYRSPWVVRDLPSSSPIDSSACGLLHAKRRLNEHLAAGVDSVSSLWDMSKTRKSFRAIVFLHDFGDGQYFYGIDGFRDLQHWVDITVEELLRRGDTTVVLKVHPYLKPETAEHNRRAHQEIARRWGSQVEWMSGPVNLLALTSDSRTAIITHHGTIAEDLALLGFAAIASRVGPWGNDFTFAHHYETLDEYRHLIEHLKKYLIGSIEPEWKHRVEAYVKIRYRDDMDPPLTRITNRVCREVLGVQPSWQETQAYLGNLSRADRRSVLEPLLADWFPRTAVPCACGVPTRTLIRLMG
jgi:hypothetical protein